jgi:hypothetical protein
MCPKIRCDGESEKFCKIFCKLSRAQVFGRAGLPARQRHLTCTALCFPRAPLLALSCRTRPAVISHESSKPFARNTITILLCVNEY